MRAGDRLRFRGPGGAEFVVTVGPAFDERTINARVESGEWTPVEEPQAPSKKSARRAPRKSTAKSSASSPVDSSEETS